MNKSELVAAIAQNAELSKKDAENALAATINAISKTLAEGDKVQLVGFGTFDVRERAAREGKNPRTGETVNVPACKVPAFKVGSKLKEAVNG
jgi:DNA-binding protein HU-beta